MKIIKNDRKALSNLSKLRSVNFFVNKTKKIVIKGMSSKLIPKKFKPKFEGINKVIAKIDPIRREFIRLIIVYYSLWARQDSNLRPTDYESVALTN